jgi:hypothetical protein
MTKIVELIYSNSERRGSGSMTDPVRIIEQWFEKDGTLVFEKDSFSDENNKDYIDKDLIAKILDESEHLDDAKQAINAYFEG